MQKTVTKAIIPAAGWGTRLLPATKALPKELLPIVDTPVLELVVEEAAAAGVREVIFVINTGKEAIWNHFSPNRPLEQLLEKSGKKEALAKIRRFESAVKFSFVIQPDQLGDGHAVLQARELCGDEPFFVLFGDDLVVSDSGQSAAQQLLATFQVTGSTVVALQEIDPAESEKYGIVRPGIIHESQVEIAGFVEKPRPEAAPSRLGVIGKYICTPAIWPLLEQGLAGSGEIRLIDALSELLAREKVTGRLIAGTRYDTGQPLGYAIATLDFALANPATRGGILSHISRLSDSGRLR